MDGPRMHENAFELMTLTEDLPNLISVNQNLLTSYCHAAHNLL